MKEHMSPRELHDTIQAMHDQESLISKILAAFHTRSETLTGVINSLAIPEISEKMLEQTLTSARSTIAETRREYEMLYNNGTVIPGEKQT